MIAFKTYKILISDSAEGGSIWADMIHNYIKTESPRLKLDNEAPELVIVLGGDGTIIKAITEYRSKRTVYLGLNMGTMGFLASEHSKSMFIEVLQKVLDNEFIISKRIALSGSLFRNNEEIETLFAVNDISIQSLVGNVSLSISVNGQFSQKVKGGGVLVSSPTGSTGTNLSAKGPVVKSDLRCIIISEIMDHNLPTPSLIVGEFDNIDVTVKDFRKRDILVMTDTDDSVDVVLKSDGRNIIKLQKGDVLKITRYKYLIDIIEIEENYFFKSLQKHFGFK
jgi:NAD+ kinase